MNVVHRKEFVMLCEKCKKKKATFYYNENINGQHRSFHLCADCTSAMEASGELEEFSFPFPQLVSPLSLFDDSFSEDTSSSILQGLPLHAPERTCPQCGIQFQEIAATGKVGCATCYDIFSSRLLPGIKALHGNREHAGSAPRVYRKHKEKQARIAKLKEQLKTAIHNEAFEDAVLLRDELRKLEK